MEGSTKKAWLVECGTPQRVIFYKVMEVSNTKKIRIIKNGRTMNYKIQKKNKKTKKQSR